MARTADRRRSPRNAALESIEVDAARQRTRLHFDIDGYRHTVHAVFHGWPDLHPDAWQACREALALACLVDVSTASMARTATLEGFDPGVRGRRVFEQAAEALRLELLAEHGRPVGDRRVSLVCEGSRRAWRPQEPPRAERVLLLMGGGKDSLYTYSLLTRAGYDVRCFYLTESRRTWQQLRRVFHALRRRQVQYRAFLDAGNLDPLERKFHTGYFSQFQIGEVVAASLPYALASGCRYVAVGMERSSDVATGRYRGLEVNHQHQKSVRFLRTLNAYLLWRFGGSVEVVSPLQGLWDAGIYGRFLFGARKLVRLQSSCGGANGRSPHCGRCGKCAFLAALFAGLARKRDLPLYRRLFPRDPLEDTELFRSQWWAGSRPLGCVGLEVEVFAALDVAAERGWPGRVVRAWSQSPAFGRSDGLAPFLDSTRSRVLPAEMWGRIAPILDRDASLLAQAS